MVSAVLLWVLAAGLGPIPPLGAALDAGSGAWTSAAGGRPATSQTLRLPGLQDPVSVSYTAQGIAAIRAATDHDVFLALGYVHASFRLGEMDEERRLGEGRLAQLAGPSDLASDEFELRLGLLRTAQREWAQTPRSSPAGQALLAYAQGVNDDIARVRADGDWPATFSLARAYPAPWTPVDSLVVQGVLTEELDFTTTPLDYALLERSLGLARTMAWFPVIPANTQSPYDPGPYQHPALTPLAPDAASTAPGPVGAGLSAAAAGPAGPAPGTARSASSAAVATAAGTLLAQISRFPSGLVHREPDSNAWAANGPAVAGNGAMLAGDPHLPQTLPSIWYEAALSAPGFDTSGVTVPGVPGVLIGHNAHIAWSLTDTQNQTALFYAEQTSASRPDQYHWRGAWRRTRKVHYTIDVRGGAAVPLTVYLTVHGPIMTQAGQTMAVDWMGNVPSADVSALLGVDEASNFGQFNAALASWHAPTQNFVYADARGHIGVISAGYYPQVAHGDPWLPLPGTGTDDIDGVIPYPAEPQVYDPPGHVVATANQRRAHRGAPQVMRSAFSTAVAHLATRLGGAPGNWTWGRLHTRYFPSLTGASGLGYGPRAASGDAWTVDAAEGGLKSSIGPSWRMIMGFPDSGGSLTAEGVYPGGQSENPASAWYANLITDWWDGRYLPMPGTAGADTGAIHWTLRPGALPLVASRG